MSLVPALLCPLHPVSAPSFEPQACKPSPCPSPVVWTELGALLPGPLAGQPPHVSQHARGGCSPLSV